MIIPKYNPFEYPLPELTDKFFNDISSTHVICKLCNKKYIRRTKKTHLINRHHPNDLELFYNKYLQ